ncbi:hypothetical protein RRG08_031223 [Elysia crispata]|uniref:Uncharacterized protein n=1 Tax=Elysia crispata TaxID=231223 RepID=A0AAE0XMS1_9GAST|nr:hypothetical protein RRG08_031223 [Elysia crispata]
MYNLETSPSVSNSPRDISSMIRKICTGFLDKEAGLHAANYVKATQLSCDATCSLISTFCTMQAIGFLTILLSDFVTDWSLIGRPRWYLSPVSVSFHRLQRRIYLSPSTNERNDYIEQPS